MKKQIFVIGIFIILVSIGLSGCNEEQSDTPQKIYLDGWYYSFYGMNCEPFKDINCYKYYYYNISFVTNEYTTAKMRVIVQKDSPEDIKVSLRNSRDQILHTFETSNDSLDEEYSLPLGGFSESYIIYSENGDVRITILEYFSHVDSSYITSCDIPLKYYDEN